MLNDILLVLKRTCAYTFNSSSILIDIFSLKHENFNTTDILKPDCVYKCLSIMDSEPMMNESILKEFLHTKM